MSKTTRNVAKGKVDNGSNKGIKDSLEAYLRRESEPSKPLLRSKSEVVISNNSKLRARVNERLQNQSELHIKFGKKTVIQQPDLYIDQRIYLKLKIGDILNKSAQTPNKIFSRFSGTKKRLIISKLIERKIKHFVGLISESKRVEGRPAITVRDLKDIYSEPEGIEELILDLRNIESEHSIRKN